MHQLALVRPNRAEPIHSQGLRIFSPSHGDFTAGPKAITASQISTPYDVIFLSVKSYGLAAAMDFAPAVGPQVVIIPVLNGMLHLDLLTQRFLADVPCWVGSATLPLKSIREAGSSSLRMYRPRSSFMVNWTGRRPLE